MKIACERCGTIGDPSFNMKDWGMLKASHAARLMRKGYSPHQAARITGYGSAHAMQKAIRDYIKSPASTPIESGADQRTLPTR